jgi:hypothetical protein
MASPTARSETFPATRPRPCVGNEVIGAHDIPASRAQEARLTPSVRLSRGAAQEVPDRQENAWRTTRCSVGTLPSGIVDYGITRKSLIRKDAARECRIMCIVSTRVASHQCPPILERTPGGFAAGAELALRHPSAGHRHSPTWGFR